MKRTAYCQLLDEQRHAAGVCGHMKEGLRGTQSGADPKLLPAAAVKTYGGEHCGNVGTRSEWLSTRPGCGSGRGPLEERARRAARHYIASSRSPTRNPGRVVYGGDFFRRRQHG